MVDSIITYVAKGILVVLSLFVFVFLMSRLYPVLFLKVERKGSELKDRGEKKFKTEGGRAVRYKPSPETGAYVKKYLLTAEGEKKQLKCQIDKRIHSLGYEVQVFDANDKHVTTVEVEDPIAAKGYTSAVVLPSATAYVSIDVKQVNGRELLVTAGDGVKPIMRLTFFAVSAVTAVLEGFLLKGIILTIADALLGYSDYVPYSGGFFTLVTSFLLGVACACLVYNATLEKRAKAKKRKRKN